MRDVWRLRMIRILVAGLVMMACGGAPKQPEQPAAELEPAPVVDASYAVAVVMQGWELWIGNDKNPKVPDDAPEKARGMLEFVKAAFDKADLARTAPAGSRGMLVTYADKPAVRVPMGPIANLTGAALGTQVDYFATTGTDLYRAVELAFDELVKLPKGKKIIVVVGDGNDTNNEEAKRLFAKLKEQVAAHDIEVVSIVYKARLSGDGDVIAELTSNTRTAPSGDALTSDLVRALEQLGK
jgi:hypothetical protein